MSLAIRPLSLGILLSAGVTLYRSHLKSYFGMSVKAYGWFIGMVMLAGCWLIGMAILISLTPDSAVQVLLTLVASVAAIAIVIYGSAKLFTLSAVITRHAFAELVSQPQSLKSIQSSFKPKLWGFLGIQVLVFLIMLAINIGISICQFVLVGLPLAWLTVIFGNAAIATRIIFLLQVLTNLAAYILYLYIWARFFIAELPYMVEPSVGVLQTIGRSWQLSQRTTRRILAVVGTLTLITLPFYALAFMPLFVVIGTVFPGLITSINEPGVADRLFLLVGGALLAGSLLFSLSGVVTMPFWQALKAVVYYDLRIRREGMGLRLRDRPN